jgi:hypothetical protein
VVSRLPVDRDPYANPGPQPSFEASPERNERVLFAISVAILVLLVLSVLAWSLR